MQLRKMTMEEREMSAYLNEDYHAYNEVKAMTSVQKTNFELISAIGDKNDELVAQINTYDAKIKELNEFIVQRRAMKDDAFSGMPESIRSVMQMHYLSYMTFEQIAEELSYHVSSVKRNHIAGLQYMCEVKSHE